MPWGTATTGSIILCMLAKILLTAVLFMMILMLIPLDATLMNALISLLDSEIFGVGLGRSAVVC